MSSLCKRKTMWFTAGEQSESGNSDHADQDAAGDVVADGAPDAQQLQARREANIAAMLTDR